MRRSPGWCARVFGFGVQRSKCFLDGLRRCVVQPEQQVCWWPQVIWSIFPQSFTGGKTLAPFLASASGVLETDGFGVCDAAQSFLGLGKGTQVLYTTSNGRSTLCDPDNTFHANAFSGRFSFLKEHTCWPKKKHHLSFSNPCVCQTSNTSPIHLLPNSSEVGLDESLCDVFAVTAPLRCAPCTTLPSL